MNNRFDAQQAANYLALAEQASPEIVGPQGAMWLDRLESEYAQFRAALHWYVENREPEEGLRLAKALYRFWATRRQYVGEGRRWFAQLLELPSGTAGRGIRAEALGLAGALAFRQGDTDTARALTDESLSICHELGHNDGVATGLADLARLDLREGLLEQARGHAEESLAIWRGLGDRPRTVGPLHLLAASARMQGDYDRAAQLYAETSAIYRELGDDTGVAGEHFNVGYVTLRQGNTELAAQHFEEALRFYRGRGDESMIAASLAGLGGVSLALGEPKRATWLLAASAALNEKLGVILDPDDKLEFERDAAGSRASLEAADYRGAWAEGQRMTLEQAIACALNKS